MKMPKFFLPTARQYRCLSGCGLLLLFAIGGTLALVFAAMAALPSVADYLEQFDSSTLIEIALNETYESDDFRLQLVSIESDADGVLSIGIDWLVTGVPSQSVNLSFNTSIEEGTASALPNGYILRLISATENSVRLQIISPMCFAEQPRNETGEISPDEGYECP